MSKQIVVQISQRNVDIFPNTIYMIKIVNIAEYQDDTIYTTFKYESNPLSIHDHTTLLLNVAACWDSQLSIIRYNHLYI